MVDDSDSPLLHLPNTYRAFYGAFTHLHPVQRQVIAPLLEGRDLVLQSATGTGKTEAVLAPCIERVIRSRRAAAVVYVVPTRALALDLERRLGPVCERLRLGLAVRTGDLKRAGGGRPDLLLTTPESLDVTLGSANADLRGFVERVQTVIIDEVQPLLHRYRGQQLAYLLQRLARRSASSVQKVALSATISDADAVVHFFGFRPDAARVLMPVQREIAPHLVHLKDEDRDLVALLDDLYEAWGYRKILLFANSRGRCDRLFALLNHEGRFQGRAELHYSNLKPKERRGVEHRFRRRAHALCVATSTLELGIDIGDVDGVLLYEPPDSVSAFLQRIGRANRRQRSTQYWGLCRGERAGDQLLRFLALQRLARQGHVEAPVPGALPSVLVQQILSCLYEKKRISLPALRELFPCRGAEMEDLFTAMIRQGWLREERVKGLLRGGWRYRDALLERKIWSNFPEAEEDYTLELADEAVADLPKSVVRQLEPGDRVQLAGRRLQVLQIEDTERKRVTARLTDLAYEKELFWLGAGFQVSYEVARSIREVLAPSAAEGDEDALGLFTRTRRLLQAQREQAGQTVVLANGIEVGRSWSGLYRYRTYFGAVGNLILQWTIEQDLASEVEDLTVTADEVGLECSHWIDFRKLSLPVDRATFRDWADRRLPALRSLFPLNAFCAALPRALLVEEMTGFLFDARVAEAFARYLKESSEIVSGDPTVLEGRGSRDAARAPTYIDTAMPDAPLLAWERQRWGVDGTQGVSVSLPDVPYRSRSLTGTMVGAYIRHRQCARWLSFGFLPPEARPAMRTRMDDEVDVLRTEHGRLHEARVLACLQEESDGLLVVAETDEAGAQRSLRARFAISWDHVNDLVRRVEAEPEKTFYLAQAVLMVPAVLGRKGGWMQHIDGVGIPDLIRVSSDEQGPVLAVGDVKDSLVPRDNHKWQVAFYALLLEELIRRRQLPSALRVAREGFLITRPRPGSVRPGHYAFNLDPYLAAFPALRRNVGQVLANSPAEAAYRLEPHCVTCPYFEHCYREALQIEDILFLPQLTAGSLEKLRARGLKTIAAASDWFERTAQESAPDNRFSPVQRERLEGRLTALRTNRIGLRERKTRLFPANLSTALFIHLVEDPVSRMPRVLGWRVLDQAGAVVDARTWTVVEETELSAVGQAFSKRFLAVWQEHVGGGRGPHVFHFGARSWQGLLTWGEEVGLGFLGAPGRLHHTDLRRLFSAHFDLPAPGMLTLFALGRLLGFEAALAAPTSLFHDDESPPVAPEVWRQEAARRREVAAHVEAVLDCQVAVWRWAAGRLESGWEQRDWAVRPGEEATPETRFLAFLEEERRLQEEDILALQAYTLQERVDRFRAIGPLAFSGMALDEEGRFLYRFQTAPEIGLSKFREGDFLKLAPLGLPDLQRGFPVILTAYDRNAGWLHVQSRQGRLALNKQLRYSLEEDLADWNGPRLNHAVRTVYGASHPHPLANLLTGGWTQEHHPVERRWVQEWLQQFGKVVGLNPTQQQALALPFRYRLSLVEGPPGTGKTHLLAWTLIALVQRAYTAGTPLRIAVSALTHQAIDQVLHKVTALVNRHGLHDFPGRCLKWGRRAGDEPAEDGPMRVEPLADRDAFAACRYPILGATGFGLYQLFEGQQGTFPPVFDWVLFDEASQVLLPQALLSLLYGKGNVLFAGDVHQLPPIVLGRYEASEETGLGRSILAHLIRRYGPAHRIRLDQTYRMNAELCRFPSQTWYDGALQPAPGHAHLRLALPRPGPDDLLDRILDPEKPVALLLVDHRGCRQKADLEVEIVSQLAHRLLAGQGLSADQLALISPHRAQNNAVAERLGQLLGEAAALPLIDTVERVQGAERDVIVYALTTSDLDFVERPFLNNPNRFNVAITRARRKLIVVGSHAFFATVPREEDVLRANRCFKAFYAFCEAQDSLFVWDEWARMPEGSASYSIRPHSDDW